MLIQLIVGHILCDFPLQGDFVSKWKNRHVVLEGKQTEIWWLILTYHAIIHGYMVFLITTNPYFGCAECIIHWLTDFTKCEGKLTFNQDQFIHLACKLLWFLLS